MVDKVQSLLANTKVGLKDKTVTVGLEGDLGALGGSLLVPTRKGPRLPPQPRRPGW